MLHSLAILSVYYIQLCGSKLHQAYKSDVCSIVRTSRKSDDFVIHISRACHLNREMTLPPLDVLCILPIRDITNKIIVFHIHSFL